MSLFVFQNSRRQLLEMLLDEFNKASVHRKEHEASGKAEGPNEKQRIDNLLKAVHAADQEVKRLEYWSDIRRMVREGHTNGATDDTTNWPTDMWQGLDPSGPLGNDESQAKQKGKANSELHKDAGLREALTSPQEEFRDPEEQHEFHNHSTEAVQSSAYETAEEGNGRTDKGKGRAT